MEQQLEMNFSAMYQTDLEVIMEFLGEHYRQEGRREHMGPNRINMGDLYALAPSEVYGNDLGVRNAHCDQFEHTESVGFLSLPTANQQTGESDLIMTEIQSIRKPVAGLSSSALDNKQHLQTQSSHTGDAFTVPGRQSIGRHLTRLSTPRSAAESLPETTPAERGRKLRLFRFLFEMLENPKMAHCVSWVPASAGLFRFSSTHKEHVAELWGQRKGNRRPMTYQKMSRALRNYARSGEIIKVRKKLTYQFSQATLTTLRSQQDVHKARY